MNDFRYTCGIYGKFVDPKFGNDTDQGLETIEMTCLWNKTWQPETLHPCISKYLSIINIMESFGKMYLFHSDSLQCYPCSTKQYQSAVQSRSKCDRSPPCHEQLLLLCSNDIWNRKLDNNRWWRGRANKCGSASRVWHQQRVHPGYQHWHWSCQWSNRLFQGQVGWLSPDSPNESPQKPVVCFKWCFCK